MILLTRHWNTIADMLLRGGVHMPLMFDDENSIAKGSERAIGFEQESAYSKRRQVQR